MLANYPLVKLISKDLFSLSHATKIVKLLPDNNTISYVICLANTTNKSNIDVFLIKYKQVTDDVLAAKVYAMVH